ncbi:MAG: hypothetical protein K0R26_2898 [Bacteroidota bacterium]|nr:hypothetical protein [Bacteroidota bacterium]
MEQDFNFMRVLLLIIILFFGVNVFSQSTDSSSVSKWYIGITASPDMCYRIPYVSKTSALIKNEQRNKIIACFGINIVYRPSKKLNIETGIWYSGKGQVTISPEATWQTPGGTYDPSIPNYSSSVTQYTPEKRIAIKYQYLEIPLKFNTCLLNKRFKVFPCIGGSVNFFIGKTTSVNYKENGKMRTETNRDFNKKNIPLVDVALIAGLGFGYDVSHNLMVKLEPNYRQFIRPMVDFPVSGYLYSIGCNVGVYIKL